MSDRSAVAIAPIAKVKTSKLSSRPSLRRRLVGKLGIQVASVAVFLTLWQWAGSQLNPILLATPTAVVAAFFDLLNKNQLQPEFALAMGDLFIGFALATIVGVTLGFLMGRSRTFEQILNPYINFMQATPLIALVPLVVVWFGIGLEARVTVVFILAVWSIIINTATGVKGTPVVLIEVGRIFHLTTFEQLRWIAFPFAVPYIFSGLRLGLGKALIGMVIAEMQVTVVGLGGLLLDYGAQFKTAYLLAVIVTASMVGVFTAIGLDLVVARFFPWVQATSTRREV